MRVQIDTDHLREQAQAELDAAQARYSELMAFIKRVEEEYANPRNELFEASEWRGIRQAVREAIPHLAEITVPDIFQMVCKMYPHVPLSQKQIKTAIRRLLVRGELVRVRDAVNGLPAIYEARKVATNEEDEE